MTDSRPPNSTNRNALDRDAFARFLVALSADPEEAGKCYLLLHEKLVGYFGSKGISDSTSAADETIDRAATKINAGAPVPDVNRYCFGIARFIVKERLRLAQRESTAFLAALKHFDDSPNEHIQKIHRIYKPCFEQLEEKDRQLLVSYYGEVHEGTRAQHRTQLAANENMSVLALRMRVTRSRSKLTDCASKLLPQLDLTLFEDV